MYSHMGDDFFPEAVGGNNASKIVKPPKKALRDGILSALLGEGYVEEGKERGQTFFFFQNKTGIFVKT